MKREEMMNKNKVLNKKIIRMLIQMNNKCKKF